MKEIMRDFYISCFCSLMQSVKVYVYVASERTNIHVLFTMLFAVGSDISILRAPMAAAIGLFMSPLNPLSP